MSNVESCRDRQKNELEVLQSIFGNELTDLRKNKNKKKWPPLDIVITLTPQKGMSGPAEVYAQIDLRIICSEKYPEVVPDFKLQNSQGLSNQQIEDLHSELKQLAKTLEGEVMIFDIAQNVQKFLHKHNKPSYGSIYEEMVSKQKERIAHEMQERQLKEDKERQEIQDEIEKCKETFKSEIRNQKELRLYTEKEGNSQSIPSSPHDRMRTIGRRRCVSTSEYSVNNVCEHRGTKFINFESNKGERQIYRGKCLSHSEKKGFVAYAGVDMTTGDLLAVKEWTFKAGNSDESNSNKIIDLQHSMKQIISLEQELNHLYKLHHPNLVHYINMKYFQETDSIVINVLQEFVVGTMCSSFLTKKVPVDIDILRHLASGILSALQYLHENDVVHKDLRDSSVYIDQKGDVRLADYSLEKRLSDICDLSSNKLDHDFPTIQGRGGKKADIYRFGVLLLSLFRGNIVSGDETDVSAITELHLRDFLSKCLIKDERTRWSADQLQQHSFIKTPVDYKLSSPRHNRKNEKINNEPEEPESDVQNHFPTLGGQSRIQNEFEVLKWLGKGAFGDVLKVRNKLDGGVYAIKRIKLNPKKKILNRKITREVKLLSRLSHENVVRYYNSWIESATVGDSSRHTMVTPTSSKKTNDFISELNDSSESEADDLEKLGPSVPEVEWNVSYESRNGPLSHHDNNDNSDSSDSDSDGDCAILMRNLLDIESSDSIEFERDGTSQTVSSVPEESKGKESDTDDKNIREIQFMYIQMEFCEKSTLRTAIDNGLYEDEERMWRLFREIIEGLAHIHQQGMIHRDLKPVNIFLDSNDHVKIGDFGLATTNTIPAFPQKLDDKESQQTVDKGGNSYEAEGSLTGEVGTALYAAPELSAEIKAIYNQKVDIYSLGIIFFEMCYIPLETAMERVKILLNLRSKDIIFPPEFNETEKHAQAHILRWLLNHDGSQRPTAQELLFSEYLPPSQLEETEQQEMIRHTLSNTQGNAYKYLISSCFTQEVTTAEFITYDVNFSSRTNTNFISLKLQFLHEYIKDKVIEIFRRHGGVNIVTPLLIPKCGHIYNSPVSTVNIMTANGNIVSLPHNLRIPFARYVIWNNITHIRRYSIERVYREKKARGFHPRELYECAFDIISSVDKNLMTEAELIFIVWEIINEIPELQDRNFTVHLNHTSLLQAVLMYCEIEKEKYQDIYSILCDARDGKLSKFQVQTRLISLCLTDKAMNTLFNLFENESTVARISSILKTISKRKGDTALLAKEGLQELENLISIIEDFGVKWPIKIAPLLVHNMQQYSGVIFQISYESIRKGKKSTREDVVAAGGRYDKVLASFKKVIKHTSLAKKDTKQFGVGISISLDKLVCCVNENSDSICNDNKFGNDVVVCYNINVKREKEIIDVLKELWSLGIRVVVLDLTTVDEIFEYSRENKINHTIILREGEIGILRVQTWDKDRFHERKMAIHEISDYFQRQTESIIPILNRSDSKASTNEVISPSNNFTNVNVNFIFSEKDKTSGNMKRSFKNSILAQTSTILQRLSNKVPVEIFAVYLEMTVVRTIMCNIEVDLEESEFQRSVQAIVEKHPKHKKTINEVCEDMRESRNEKTHPVLVLYSLNDRQFMTYV